MMMMMITDLMMIVLFFDHVKVVGGRVRAKQLLLLLLLMTAQGGHAEQVLTPGQHVVQERGHLDLVLGVEHEHRVHESNTDRLDVRQEYEQRVVSVRRGSFGLFAERAQALLSERLQLAHVHEPVVGLEQDQHLQTQELLLGEARLAQLAHYRAHVAVHVAHVQLLEHERSQAQLLVQVDVRVAAELQRSPNVLEEYHFEEVELQRAGLVLDAHGDEVGHVLDPRDECGALGVDRVHDELAQLVQIRLRVGASVHLFVAYVHHALGYAALLDLLLQAIGVLVLDGDERVHEQRRARFAPRGGLVDQVADVHGIACNVCACCHCVGDGLTLGVG